MVCILGRELQNWLMGQMWGQRTGIIKGLQSLGPEPVWGGVGCALSQGMEGAPVKVRNRSPAVDLNLKMPLSAPKENARAGGSNLELSIWRTKFIFERKISFLLLLLALF